MGESLKKLFVVGAGDMGKASVVLNVPRKPKQKSLADKIEECEVKIATYRQPVKQYNIKFNSLTQSAAEKQENIDDFLDVLNGRYFKESQDVAGTFLTINGIAAGAGLVSWGLKSEAVGLVVGGFAGGKITDLAYSAVKTIVALPVLGIRALWSAKQLGSLNAEMEELKTENKEMLDTYESLNSEERYLKRLQNHYAPRNTRPTHVASFSFAN